MRLLEPKRILVPVDFTEVSDRAMTMASALGRRYGAELRLLYADRFLPPAESVELPRSIYARRLAELEEGATERLRRYCSMHAPRDLKVTVEVAVESADEAIVDCAEANDVDLIVMGTHGRTGWRRVVYGSVAESVLRATSRPVLTVPAGANVDHPIAKIVCPVNYSDVAQIAIEYAGALALSLAAELVVVNVIEDSDRTELRAELDKLRAWVPSQIVTRCRFKELMLTGDPARAIIELATRVDADLLVLGAQHKRFFDETVIGTTSEKLVRHAPCPVLTVVRTLASMNAKARDEELAEVGQ